MKRRTFLAAGAAGSIVLGTSVGSSPAAAAAGDAGAIRRPFKLKFAPHFGMFRHSAGGDLVDQLQFAADQGFRAWEDNEMKDRTVAMQERIAAAMGRLGMEMGVISALRGVWDAVNFAAGDEGARNSVLAAIRGIVPVAQRVNAKWLTVVPGLENPKLPAPYQTASCIELLKRCCDILAPHDLVMVLEPLNRLTNHPGVFLHQSPQAYLLCRAVDHPSCKILFDVYHQQVTEGNLIANIDHCWSEIAYFQSADNPGRNEPGTGEINYKIVLQHIYDRDYRGVVGLEHGNSQPGADGEEAVIAAYRTVDPA
jgi:hydroxypyruvate isomerase